MTTKMLLGTDRKTTRSRFITLSLTLAALSASAQAAPLADHLPSGALLTLETHNAGGALGRFAGLLDSALKQLSSIGMPGDASSGIHAVEQVLKSSIGQEAVVGVFSVSGKDGPTPQVLAVTRVDEFSGDFFRSMISGQHGAKVGVYPLARQGDAGIYAGMAGGLAYVSTDKSLLTSYLGRLSGKVAPTLGASPLYAAPTKGIGPQEMSLYLNFSGMAKVVRAQLARAFVPRILSPIVDAVDTLGQYSAGFSTSDAGISAQAAQAINPQGKDRTLANLLTHTSTFEVQNMIPSTAESVTASACAPEDQAYAGRWLTRLDLYDPTGFLTDSQLAAHLERASQYLGDECAQVLLAGAGTAGMGNQALKTLDYMVTYRKVSDMDAAQAALPEYAASVNTAIKGAAGWYNGLLKQALGDLGGMSELSSLGALSSLDSLKQLGKQIGNVKMVYAFRDDYLITAFSDKALAAALAENVPTLASDASFLQAGLVAAPSAGWQYVRPPQKITSAQFMTQLSQSLPKNDPSMSTFMKPVADFVADLYNRYGGMTSQRTKQGNLMVSKSNVLYRFK